MLYKKQIHFRFSAPLSFFLFMLIFSGVLFSAFTGNRETGNGNQEDTTLILTSVSVDISYPPGKTKGYILVLPGWNFTKEDVCRNSDFCKLARQSGYCLIRPEMGKCAYILSYFKETRKDYLHNPTLSWVIDTLIPFCQKKLHLLQPGSRNFLFGISTGGRGVAQVAIHTGTLFTAGAALSGDYNQLLQKDDNLMIGYLGLYETFPSRWSGNDNPFMQAEQLKIPLFLGHGKQDKIVPVEQTNKFFERITTLNPRLGHILHIDESGGHNYNYWNSEMQRIFAFFNRKSITR
jgi:hypothetical protein